VGPAIFDPLVAEAEDDVDGEDSAGDDLEDNIDVVDDIEDVIPGYWSGFIAAKVLSVGFSQFTVPFG